MSLAKMGMLLVTLWDFDNIESHNIPNQHFGIAQEGQHKAVAMAEHIKLATNIEYATKGKWKNQKLAGLVFSCVDSMQVRKSILRRTVEGMFIETRMGVFHGQVFSIDPQDKKQVEFWESNWVGDDVIEEKSACGSSLTIGATAQLLSSIATWQGIRYLREEKDIPRGITASVNPYTILEL